MHTTAHPDDEHGGMLALLSRRDGARVALLTLNRGESGDNAIGPQLFDGLGLIRTEELAVSNGYYGVDDQYFTTVLDYGFSKRLDEAFEKWGKENVLRDVVRIIRMNRPLVLISRFQGSQRDGHGNHQTAGLITREAFRAAGDPAMFPEQIAEGLRPWQARKVYIGGVREGEKWHVRVDPGEFSPWLGDSYANFASLGLSFQRSQTSGRMRAAAGPMYAYYARVGSVIEAPEQEQGFFDGIDTTLPGLFTMLGRPAPPGAVHALQAADAAVKKAMTVFSLTDPAASAPALAEGLAAVRSAIEKSAGDADAVFLLRVKERQCQDAIGAALGVELSASAQPEGTQEPTGMFAMFAPAPSMNNVVPGQAFEVKSTFVHRGGPVVELFEMGLQGARGLQAGPGRPARLPKAGSNQPVSVVAPVQVALDAAPSNRPYFTRASIAESRYTLLDPTQFGRSAAAPTLEAWARYTVAGVPVETRAVVTRRQPNLPYGYDIHELAVVPALSLSVSPATAVIPVKAPRKQVQLQVDLLHNVEGVTKGELSLTLPTGWTSSPAGHAFAFARGGERATFRFTVSVPALENKPYAIEAVASAGGRQHREGYEIIEQRDLEQRFLYRPARTSVRGVDVDVVPGLKVGYVMGIGDQVPSGVAQLGYEVTMLGPAELASSDLSQFDAIMTGTRAYAVREDLRTYNRRLLEYVQGGGNLIVLYNTAELVPSQFAPFPGELTPRAEEVSEEDSPVEILAPQLQALTWPNPITNSDFDGWVEQRGSKFWSKWDPAYTAVIATWDKGQAPQQGGWLQAKYGKGTYTYFAYAFHRQLPYGVPGAYRLLANVLALGRTPNS